MFKPQNSLQSAFAPQPFKTNMTSLSWGKVVKRHPDSNSFDVACQFGGTFQKVPMAANLIGSHVGSVYLPEHDLTSPTPDPHGTWDTPVASGGKDVYVILGFLQGSSRQPVILGFLPPLQSQMQFQTPGIQVLRHESGVYRVTLPSQNGQCHDEIHFPDGSYFVVGDTASHDMSTENQAWNPPTQTGGVNVTLHHSSGTIISIDTSGNVTISTAVAAMIKSTGGLTLEDTTTGVTIRGKTTTQTF